MFFNSERNTLEATLAVYPVRRLQSRIEPDRKNKRNFVIYHLICAAIIVCPSLET